jgi:hypothetical protein
MVRPAAGRSPLVFIYTAVGNPTVLWHEPTRRWVMVLYVGLPGGRQRLTIICGRMGLGAEVRNASVTFNALDVHELASWAAFTLRACHARPYHQRSQGGTGPKRGPN